MFRDNEAILRGYVCGLVGAAIRKRDRSPSPQRHGGVCCVEARGRRASRRADSPWRPPNARKAPNRMAAGNRKASTGPGSGRLNITFYDENRGRPESESPWGRCRVSGPFSSVAFENGMSLAGQESNGEKKKKSMKETRFQSCDSCGGESSRRVIYARRLLVLFVTKSEVLPLEVATGSSSGITLPSQESETQRIYGECN